MQILELSGIGDPDVLQKAGIKVSVDLRGVGANVQDHCNVGLVHRTTISSHFIIAVLRAVCKGERRDPIRLLDIRLLE